MNISGYGSNASYYSYIYSGSAYNAGLTSDSMNPVGDLFSSKLRSTQDIQSAQSTQSAQNIYASSIAGSDASAFQDIMTMQYKLQKEQEYDAELEDARINDPEKYEKMQKQRQQDIAKSFRQVEEIARESGDGKTGMATYKGVPIVFDFEHSVMTVGDMSSGDIINVGKLSNGYAFSFNRDNIDDISKILDLFSPEDINKIMAAITTDNIAKSMEQEIEDEKAKIGKTAEVDADGVVTDTVQKQNAVNAKSRDRLDMLTPAIKDLDQSAAVGGKNGIGFSVYYMNRANDAYEDQFVYAR